MAKFVILSATLPILSLGCHVSSTPIMAKVLINTNHRSVLVDAIPGTVVPGYVHLDSG